MEVSSDTEHAVEFLKQWQGAEGPWVVTSIGVDNNIGIETVSFTNEDSLHKWIEHWQGVRNIYFQINPLRRQVSKKAGKEDVDSVVCLHVDIDPRTPDPKETDLKGFTEKEQKRIIALLKEKRDNLPPASVIIFSGGGYQALWRLKEPFKVKGDLEKAAEVERYTKQLESVFDADNCHNIDRIFRLPGTINVPDARKRRKGRVPCQARLVSFSKDRYDLSQFIAAAQVQTTPSTLVKKSVSVSGNIQKLTEEDIQELKITDKLKQVIIQGKADNKKSEGKDDSRSAWLFYCACQLVRARIDDEIIYSIFMTKAFGISSSILEKRSGAHRYALRQITRAHEYNINPKLDEMNQRFAVIRNIGGKCRIVEEVPCPIIDGRKKLTFQSFGEFKNGYSHLKVETGTHDKKGDPIKKPLGIWWLDSENRRQYDSLVFAPNRIVPNAYNLWDGFSCDALPGDCSLFLDHVKDNVCGGNEEHYAYLMGWLARLIQKPDSPGHTAIVLRGKQGTGKSFFAKAIGSLVGRHYLPISDPKHLVGNFNAHLRDCLVLFADEAFYAGDRKHGSVLKMLITEEMIPIEAKGVDIEPAPNFCHIIMASNENWVIPAGAEERRYFVLDVGEACAQKSEYFKAIADQLDNGGKEALLHVLSTYDISKFEVRNVPKTEALQAQKLHSLSAEESWWKHMLDDGVIASGVNWGQTDDNFISTERIYRSYIEACEHIRGQFKRMGKPQLIVFMEKMCRSGLIKRKRQEDETYVDEFGVPSIRTRQKNGYLLPSLAKCQEAWDYSYRVKTKWDEELEEVAQEGRKLPF